MADFTTQIGGPQKSQISIKAPAVEPASGNELLGLAQTMVPMAQTMYKAKVEGDEAASVSGNLSSFSQRLEAVGQQVATGKKTLQQGRAEFFKVYSVYASANPSLKENFSDLYTKAGKEFGVSSGKTLQEVKQSAEEKLAGDALASGFVREDMSPAAWQAGINAQQEMSTYTSILEVKQKHLTYLTGAVNLDEKERGIAIAAATEEARVAIRKLSSTEWTRTQSDTDAILSTWDSNKTPQGVTAALQQLAEKRASLNQTIAQLSGGKIKQDELDLLTAAHTSLLDLTEDRINGTISDKAYTTELARNKLMSSTAAMDNPMVYALHGLTAILGSTLATDVTATKVATDYIAQFTKDQTLPTPTPETAEARVAINKSYIEMAKTIGDYGGDYKDAKMSELQDYATATLDVIVNGDEVSRPSDLTTAIQFYADPHIRAAIKRGDIVLPIDGKAGTELLQMFYADRVNGAIQSVLGRTVGGKPIDTYYEQRLVGNKIKFLPTPELVALEEQSGKGTRGLRGEARKGQFSTISLVAELQRHKGDLAGLAATLTDTVTAASTLTGQDIRSQYDILAGNAPAPKVQANDQAAVEPEAQLTQSDLVGNTIDTEDGLYNYAGWVIQVKNGKIMEATK